MCLKHQRESILCSPGFSSFFKTGRGRGGWLRPPQHFGRSCQAVTASLSSAGVLLNAVESTLVCVQPCMRAVAEMALPVSWAKAELIVLFITAGDCFNEHHMCLLHVNDSESSC